MPAASSPLTRFDVREGIATLTLVDAPRMNPLSAALLSGCLDALRQVHEDRSVRVLVVKATGKGFSSGADLADLEPATAHVGPGQTVGDSVAALMGDFGSPWVLGLRDLPVPVLASVHGAIAGGGVGFTLAADIVVAARSAYFYLPFVPALGLVPDMGAPWFLLRAIGHPRTMALSLLGERLSAEQAERWGLIWACVADDALEQETARVARRLAALPSHSALEARALLRSASEKELALHLEYERQRQRELVDGECCKEGVRAFRERRAPTFPPR